MSRPARSDLADRLHSAAIHLLRRVRRTDPRTGVPPAQLSVLSVLMHGPRTIGELAAAEQVRPPTMTRLVQDLEAAGLVRREPDASDRRVVRVRSTRKGERVLAKGREMRIAELERRLARLSPRERSELERGVEIVEALVRDE